MTSVVYFVSSLKGIKSPFLLFFGLDKYIIEIKGKDVSMLKGESYGKEICSCTRPRHNKLKGNTI
jgi:hypothetical protein